MKVLLYAKTIKFCQRGAETQDTVKWTQSTLGLSHTIKVREISDDSTLKKLTTQHSSIRTVTYHFSNTSLQLQTRILLTLNIEARNKNLQYLSKPRHLLPHRKTPALHCKLRGGEAKQRATHPYSGATYSGPLERHRQQGDRNPESDAMCTIYPQNKRPYLFLQPWSRHCMLAIDIRR
jgi:hypothetical protein